MFSVKYDTVLRGQVVRPAVKKPLPLHSGRNLPLGQEAPPTGLWEEPGGCYFAHERDVEKRSGAHNKQDHSYVSNLRRVCFLRIVQRCGLTAAKAQALFSRRPVIKMAVLLDLSANSHSSCSHGATTAGARGERSASDARLAS